MTLINFAYVFMLGRYLVSALSSISNRNRLTELAVESAEEEGYDVGDVYVSGLVSTNLNTIRKMIYRMVALTLIVLTPYWVVGLIMWVVDTLATGSEVWDALEDPVEVKWIVVGILIENIPFFLMLLIRFI